MDPLPLAVFLGSIAILVGVLALDRTLMRRRCDSCRQCAEQLGLTYETKATPFAGTDVGGLWFFDQGASTPARNVMQGSVGGCAMVVFDLTLFNPTEAAYETTIAAFRSPRGKLPVFQLGTKHTIERLREALAPKSLSLPDSEFTRTFYLYSSDTSLRSFLTGARLAELRQHARNYRVESSPDWLVIYRPGVKVPTGELARFIEQAGAIAASLLTRGPDVPKPAAVG